MFEVFVEGSPVPQGSMRAFPVGGRCVITSDNPKLKSWRATVTQAVVDEMDRRRDDELMQMLADKPAALASTLVFYLPKPPSVKREYPTVKPDKDKLERAVNDALTYAGLWADDGNVIDSRVLKRYAGGVLRPGVEIKVWRID